MTKLVFRLFNARHISRWYDMHYLLRAVQDYLNGPIIRYGDDHYGNPHSEEA